jgi:hypothetical protein
VRQGAAALAALSTAVACTTVRPLAGRPAESASRVRLSLTDSGSAALARYLGPDVVALSGRLAGDSAGGYMVRVSMVRTADGREHRWDGDPVRVPRPLVATVGAVRVAPLRTAAVSALAAAALAGLYSAIHASVPRPTVPTGGVEGPPR